MTLPAARPTAPRPSGVVELEHRLARVWHWPALAGVLAVAALLDLWRLTQNGDANAYYSGGVRSMLQSWGNFFFVAADPGGLVSIDKAPLSLWLQAGSARVFGISPASLLVPEAIAGVLAVWVLYLLVAHAFGRTAGLLGALALAVSPVSVAVNRDNNPDALFVLLLVVSAYLATRALREGRLGWLLASAAAVGLAFNTKMLLALVVVPGIALAYLFLAPRPWRTRVWHLAAAGGVLLAVSGAWIAAVDLTPATLRPFVSGTSDNSALSLAFGYNGLGRVGGQAGGTSIGGFGGRGGFAGGGGAISGAPGLLRLFNDQLGDQGAWLLPLAALGGVAGLLVAARRRDRARLGPLIVLGGWFLSAAAVLSISAGIVHTYYVDVLAPATAALVGVGAVALWLQARRGGAGLLLPAAAVAATAGTQLVLLQRSGYLPWLQAVVALAAAGGLAVVAALALRVRALRSARARLAAVTVGVVVLAFLAAPAAWARTTLDTPGNGVFPGAGPSFVRGLQAAAAPGRVAGGPAGVGRGAGAGFGPGAAPGAGARGGAAGGGPVAGGGVLGGSSQDTQAAYRYAQAHAPGSVPLVVSSQEGAASSVLQGQSIAGMGGFTGTETVLTPEFLAWAVADGRVRYFLLGGQGGPAGGQAGGQGGVGRFGRGANAAEQTVERACQAVPASQWSSGGTANGQTLYDCAGRSAAITRSSR